MEEFVDISQDDGEEIQHAEEPSSVKRARKGFSEVWQHFEKTKDGKYAKCRFCSKVYKTSGNTSNLFDHLKRIHPTFREKAKASATLYSYFKHSETYESNSSRKQNLDAALIRMIATDIQPFSVVEDEGFRNFVQILDPRYVLPSRITLQKSLMKDLHANIKQKLQSVLNNVEHCAVTTDCWTSAANEGYLTVTCHFITNDFTLRAVVLSTKKLLVETNHSAENIASSLRAVFDEWQIMEKVTAIVTDNAYSMVKSCELLQKRHLPCFAHTLNLVVQDCLSQDYIKEVLMKSKKIVTYFKSSTIAYEKFKSAQGVEKPYSLVQEIPTRWNSAYRMIERILLTKDTISLVLLSTSKAPQPLTADEIDILKDLREILSPFDNATVLSSSSTNVTISLPIPIVCGILQSLEECKSKLKTVNGVNACVFIIERLRKRMFVYEERSVTILGTLLDPRFKKEGFRSINKADLASKALENEIVSLEPASNVRDGAESPTVQISSMPQASLFTFLKNKIATKIKSHRVDAIISIRQYLETPNANQDSNPLDFWKINTNMEALKVCVMRYFCIPATSTESERLFSKAGLIVSPKRSALKPKNVDELLFINKNYWLTE